LGLLISTGKGSYDLKRAQLTQIAADTILIDRTLALYGAETKAARGNLRAVLENLVEQLGSFYGDRSKVKSSEVKARRVRLLSKCKEPEAS
jgi:hypothetical protein